MTVTRNIDHGDLVASIDPGIDGPSRGFVVARVLEDGTISLWACDGVESGVATITKADFEEWTRAIIDTLPSERCLSCRCAICGKTEEWDLK